MEPITDSQHAILQYTFDADMEKHNVYGITSTLTLTLTVTNFLTLPSTLL